MSGADWYRLLRRMLDGQELVLSTPAQKGVQVLEAQDAALVPFRHTFVIHVNDGVFPVRATEGGIFSEEERSALIADGLPLENRSLASAARARTLAGHHDERRRSRHRTGRRIRAARRCCHRSCCLSTTPSTELPRSLDLPGRAHHARPDAPGCGGRCSTRRERCPTSEATDVRRAVLHGHAEQSRGVPDRTVQPPATMWNGVIRDPVVLDLLRSRYGPEHIWSASQLQTYTRCPFFFLIDRVLRLRPLEEAEESTSPLTFGGIAHDILERFYATSLDNVPVALSADVAARLDESIAERGRRTRERAATG
jgi:hypothetical protein